MNVRLMVIDEGHTVSGPDYGAVGNGLCESVESRELGKLITKYAKELGMTVDKCTVDYANSVEDSITKRVALANARAHDILVIIHFNNYYDESAHGCEVFILPNANGNYASTASYNKNKEFGEKILQAVCDAGDFYKRGGGVKFREDLGMLCNTRDHAVYLEVCFLSNKSDAQKYRSNKDKIARAIAETLAGKKLNNQNNSNNNSNVNVKEEYKMKYAVCYTNGVDERAAKYLRDYLGSEAQVFDATIPMGNKWSNIAPIIIAVGGDASPIGFSSYTTHRIKGDTRYSTAMKVLEICTGKTKLDAYKVK